MEKQTVNIQEIVTVDWLRSQFVNTGVKVTEIAEQTGIDRSQLSGWKTGRPMSSAVKAFFYFYFTEHNIRMLVLKELEALTNG